MVSPWSFFKNKLHLINEGLLMQIIQTRFGNGVMVACIV